jgi:hypothetical protein
MSTGRVRWSRARLVGVITLVIGTLITVGIGGGWWWTDLQARRSAHQLADGAWSAWGLNAAGSGKGAGGSNVGPNGSASRAGFTAR